MLLDVCCGSVGEQEDQCLERVREILEVFLARHQCQVTLLRLGGRVERIAAFADEDGAEGTALHRPEEVKSARGKRQRVGVSRQSESADRDGPAVGTRGADGLVLRDFRGSKYGEEG